MLDRECGKFFPEHAPSAHGWGVRAADRRFSPQGRFDASVGYRGPEQPSESENIMGFPLAPTWAPISTGISEPTKTWDDATHRPTDVQATDDHGIPLWDVEVLITSEKFGRASTTVERVRVPARTEPTITPGQPLTLRGAVLTPAVRKGGSLALYLSAEAIQQGGED